MESEEEKKDRELAVIYLFLTIMSAHAINSNPGNNKQMKELKEIYTQTNCVITNLLPSTTYYTEIIDENLDNDERMRNVAELLPESTATEHQDNYVVLVVDGKTYSHLVNKTPVWTSATKIADFSRRLAHTCQLSTSACSGILCGSLPCAHARG